MKNRIFHPFPPLVDENSKIIILGSFPSVKSREEDFYYAHPRNRFWPVIAAMLNSKLPLNREEKTSLLLSNAIALWDCIESCEISGSSDASIRNVHPNDLSAIFSKTQISKVFCNGKKSFELYKKYIEPQNGIASICLPSTSPANAAYSLEKLIEEYSRSILPYL